MKKSIFIILGLIILSTLVLVLLNTFQKEKNANDIIKENKITKEASQISIVTFGKRIEDERAYFLQWESLNKEMQTKAIKDYKTFLFSEVEFKNPNREKLIRELIQSKKTVLVYGYQFDAKKTISAFSDLIPYYEIDSTRSIGTYLYGIGYSTSKNGMIPVMLLGNMSKDSMGEHIIDYLIKFNAENSKK